MKPFDFINAINMSKKDLIRTSDPSSIAEKAYIPFITNRAMSYFQDTIKHANLANTFNNVDNLLQNDYYLNSIRVSKRFSKWAKHEENEEILCIQEYYKVSYARALDYSKVLTKEHISLIRTRITKGGNHVQSKSTSGGDVKEF